MRKGRKATLEVSPAGVLKLGEIVVHDPDPERRLRALTVLDAIGPRGKGAVPALVMALKDTAQVNGSDPRIVVLALKDAVLGENSGILAGCDEKWPLKYKAAETLAWVDPDHPDSVPVLIEALGYSPGSRVTAILAFWELGARAKAALPALREILSGTLPMQFPETNPQLEQLTLKEATKAIQRIEGSP
jgi:hypothetical protein